MLLLTNALGLGLGGMTLHVFRPKPRTVTSYTTLCDVLKLCCYIACMFIGCQGIKLLSATTSGDSKLLLDAPCNSHCNCTTAVFQPVCVPEIKGVFFSPCYAGCGVNLTNEAVKLGDCSCLSGSSSPSTSVPARWSYHLGLCDQSCKNIVVFVALTLLVGLVTRTTAVAHTILGLRVVSREEKSMALGVQEGLSSIFAYIPYPVLYGAVFDASCILWQDNCGSTGTCWVYDTDKLRYYYHGVSVFILFLAIVFELPVVYYSGRMEGFYADVSDRKTSSPVVSQDLPSIQAETVEKLMAPSNGDAIS